MLGVINQSRRACREGYVNSLSGIFFSGKHNPTDLEEFQAAPATNISITGIYNMRLSVNKPLILFFRPHFSASLADE